ncbi:MAG: hypothetical protein IT326_05300, partial [Anaerolineae bacterium]|nr:hypothetical protein [Anaerolineae bacterium]
MRNRTLLRILTFGAAALLVALSTLAAFPRRVAYAQGCSGSAASFGLTPIAVSNQSDSALTVTTADTGNYGFTGANGVTAVVLNGFGNLALTVTSASTLTAQVPAGLTPGGYSISVNYPSKCVTLGFTVTGATPTPQPTGFVRPLVTVFSYGASSTILTPGEDIDFEMTVQNQGQLRAANVVVTFLTGDLIPRATGGVVAVGDLAPGQSYRFFQPFTVNDDLNKETAISKVQVRYTDQYGKEYSETFDLSFPSRVTSGTAGPTATPTTVPNTRPQLVIGSYEANVEPLLPGSTFQLSLNITNQGATEARDITMIVGGGTSSDSSATGGTAVPGGISGGSGEFTKFAPVGSSNVQSLGTVPVGSSISASQALVVNVSTEPG